MLTQLTEKPTETLSEERRNSDYLDRATRDGGDLRLYTGESGRRYLRVWLHVGLPLWFQVDLTPLHPHERKL